MVPGGTQNLFYRKRWGISIVYMGCRSEVAQSGGNWLKLAKTVSQVCWVETFFEHYCIRSLRSSMVVFCSANLEVPGSIPAISKFFLKFPSLEVCGFKSPSRLHHFFSCVESNNLCFLLVFGLNTDLYLLTKVSDSLDVFKSSVEQCGTKKRSKKTKKEFLKNQQKKIKKIEISYLIPK